MVELSINAVGADFSNYVPNPLNSRTLAWVGLVLCSPVALGCGTKET